MPRVIPLRRPGPFCDLVAGLGGAEQIGALLGPPHAHDVAAGLVAAHHVGGLMARP
jgi:glycerol-3-phosphate dehydrogenase